MRRFILFISLVFGLAFFTDSQAQVFSDEFGKNRVQHHERFEDWSTYESDHFFTYWYGDGREIAEQAALLAEIEIKELENLLEYRINNKIDLIVYNDLTDLHQSNIGSDETVISRNNRFKSLDNKIFIYNTGDFSYLRRQIREGIGSILVNYTLYGENLKEILKNSILHNLPNWFKPGLIAYCGVSWSEELDNKLRSYFLESENPGFEDLKDLDNELAGHSFWYFLSSVYGENAIADILYLVRINQDLDNALKYVINENPTSLMKRWFEFFDNQYQLLPVSDLSQYKLEIKVKKNEQVLFGKWSPNGNQLALVTDLFGKKKVYLYDRNSADLKCVFKTGFINKLQVSDVNYPQVDWSPDGNNLLFVFEKKDILYYQKYSMQQEKLGESKKFSPVVDRVISMDYAQNETLYVSAIRKGKTDLFSFNLTGGQITPLTEDIYYEDNIAFGQWNDQKGIFFSTNRNNPFDTKRRLDSLLPITGKNAYFLSLEEKLYIPLSENKISVSSYAGTVDSNSFLIINNELGIANLQISNVKPYFSHYRDSVFYKNGRIDVIEPVLTNLYDTSRIEEVKRERIMHWKGNRRILTQHPFNITSLDVFDNLFYLSVDKREGPEFYVIPQSEIIDTQSKAKSTYFRLHSKKKSEFSTVETKAVERTILEETPKKEKKKEDGGSFFFQSKFDKPKDEPNEEEIVEEEQPEIVSPEEEVEILEVEEVEPIDTIEEDLVVAVFSDEVNGYTLNHTEGLKIEEDIRFKTSKVIPYRLKFKIHQLTTDLENSPLITGMETFLDGRDNDFANPIGITLRASAKDLLEDYVIEGAFRFPTSLNGQEYYVSFENRKKQLDKRYVLYRRTQNETVAFGGIVEEKNKLITTNLIYQLKYPLSIFGSIRLTNYMRLDNFVFRSTENASLARNSIQEQRLGSRLEYVYDNTYDIDINLRGGLRYRIFVEGIKNLFIDYNNDFTYRGSQGINTVFGADFRYYLPVLRHSVLAVRGVGAVSQGRSRILFYLGGSRNWLLPEFDNSIPLPRDEFNFYSLATNVRGFKHNTRNGTSYALSNIELRVPIVKYLTKRPIRSDFLKSLQLMGFYDIGKTFQDFDILDNSRAQSNVTIQNNDYVRVNVSFFRDQLIMSYGYGVRAKIFGYFLRLDRAQGIESGELSQNPIWHLSMGMDF